jgi:hypothetical protein
MATTITTKRIFIWLAVAFIIVFIWQQPQTASQQIGDFLGDVGRFLILVFDKLAEFLSGLAGA